MTLLEELLRAGALEPIDLQLGRLITRAARAGVPRATAELLGAAGARVSAERRRGHACVPLATLSELPPLDADWRGVSAGTPDLVLPPESEWRDALAAAASIGLCGDGTSPSPLVVDGGRVYLFRYWSAERRLGRNLRRLITAPAEPMSAAVEPLFARLFPLSDGGPDLQAEAARVALARRLAVVTGGPGTGKTTTVARILALLLAADPARRVALAAPTGKAAARLREAVEGELARLDLPPGLRERIPAHGRTLHRLLGYRPGDDRFTRDAERPLTEDVVIVDEASMVDLLLMDSLFVALRPDARVVLLGDHRQLASVETGAVLGDFCRLAIGAPEPLGGTVVELRRSYRFEERPGIGATAAAMRTGDADAAVAAMHDADQADVSLCDHPTDAADILAPIAPALDEFLEETDPATALARLAAFRILCATYLGPWGVDAMTALVERRLRGQGRDLSGVHHDHQPVLVTSNDYATGLFNGDVGVVLESDGVKRAWFADGAGSVRAIAPARLPAHRPAWALTVHKSQGSEFDHVVLVLPAGDSRVLSRELLYTAVTRARRRVDVFGTAETVATALGRVTDRRSGLAEALGMPVAPERPG